MRFVSLLGHSFIKEKDMKNNDILRSLRYTFDLNDTAMIEIFGLGDLSVTRAEVSDWLKREEDPEYKPINDFKLASFLNGLSTSSGGSRKGSKLYQKNNSPIT